MTKRIDGFKKKDFGAVIYRALSYSLLVCGILLLIEKNIAAGAIDLGIKTVSILIGAGLFLCYFFNARTRFRPGWTLPMAFILTLLGAGSMLVGLINKEYEPSVGLSSVIILLFGINGVLLLSAGIQQKSLVLRRWIAVFSLGIISCTAAALMFFNVALIREKPEICVALFMFMLSLQSFLEGIYNWKK